MEKQLTTIGYWLALICAVLTLIFRMLAALNWNPPHLGATGFSYMTFFRGAVLMFLLTIASWCRTAKPR